MTIPDEFRSFYVAGGTLPPGCNSYIERPADSELLRLVRGGTFCYVLTPRQTGKSSLMVRTISRLEDKGVRVAAIDLTRIGTVAADKWYLTFLQLLHSKLRLPMDLEEWWRQRDALSPVQRFTDFIREMVLHHIQGRVVIFVDEIDATLKLEFADDFFAAIRSVYNARAAEPALNRLTFVLLGVAAPNDLIRDPQRTPFNIGKAIDLGDFSFQDAQPLRAGLDAACPEKAKPVFDRIFHWTGGQPYLTQKLCESMLKAPPEEWTSSGVDAQVQTLFIANRTQRDPNLQVVHDSIASSPERETLLALYKKVYRGQSVREVEGAPEQTYLKLYGLVRAEGGLLKVRNEVYRRVFGAEWIRRLAPRTPWAALAAILGGIVVLAVGILLFSSWQRWQAAQTQTEALIQRFNTSSDPTIRLQSLAELLALPNQEETARALFNGLSAAEKLALFSLPNPKATGTQLAAVVKTIYSDLPNDTESNALLGAMSKPLKELDDLSAQNLGNEIGWWLQGRDSFNTSHDSQAIEAYTRAIELNSGNPGTHLDRARAYARQEKDLSALDDLTAVFKLGSSQLWKERTQQVVMGYPTLYNAVWPQKDKYIELARILPTPTHTPAPVETATRPRPSPTASPPSVSPIPPTSPPPTLATATPPPPPNVATALESASLYTAPMPEATEVAIVGAGDQVTVIGRADPGYGVWLYVRTTQGKEGFVYSKRFDWSGDVAGLKIIAAVPPVALQPLSPKLVQGTCRNPITFRWSGQIWWRQAYKVVARFDDDEHNQKVIVAESPLLGDGSGVVRDETWKVNLLERFKPEGEPYVSVFGTVEWQVSVINRNTGQVVKQSDWIKFTYNPLNGQECP